MYYIDAKPREEGVDVPKLSVILPFVHRFPLPLCHQSNRRTEKIYMHATGPTYCTPYASAAGKGKLGLTVTVQTPR